jgi:hypothetical protein
MADIFEQGQQGSRAKFVSAITTLQQLGTNALSIIENGQLNTLVEFDKRLQAVNGRRVLAWRVNSTQQAVKFIVSDFTDIDQTSTTSTVRVDSAVVSLRERSVPAEAVIKTNSFSTNIGTIETLNNDQTILRVHTDDGSTPTGEFDIELLNALTLNQFNLQIVASPSQPSVVVSVSNDQLTYTPATQVAINGYTVNVWLPSAEIKFIRIQITPSHPDDLNGNSFTFGITNFSAQATNYHLRSELLTKILKFSPQTEFVVLNAASDPNIQYYLSIYPDGDPQALFVEINSGDLIRIGTAVDTTVITSVPTNLIGLIPSDTYLNTIKVTEHDVALRIAPGLSPSDPNLASLDNEYVAVISTSLGYSLQLLNSSGNYGAPRTFKLSYVFGPALVNVQLKVRLNTTDEATSPIFHGASLNEV